MIHPDTELRFINPQIGFGVFATKPIPKGTIVWGLDGLDQCVGQESIDALPEMAREKALKYMFRDGQGRYVLCWDYTRYVNHSFTPTCMMTPFDFDVAIVDIQEGQELVGDYGMLNILEPFEPFPEPGAERSVVMPDDLANHYARWDATLASAFHHVPRLPQPLRPLLSDECWERVGRVCAGHEPLPSLRTCVCGPAKEA